MFHILFFIVLGILFGVITGLIPGFHPNTVIALLPLVLTIGPMETMIPFVIAMGISNSITDFIPSVLFGAPEAENALSVLPGHKLFLEGYGYFAIKLTVLGAVYGTLLFLPFITLMILFLPYIQNILSIAIPLLLTSIIVFMVLTEEKKAPAMAVFLITGLLGYLTTKLPMSTEQTLFPLLTGLFGLSMLLLQIKTKPQPKEQTTEEKDISKKTIKKGTLSGTIGGLISGLLPGITAAHAAVLTFVKNSEEFLVSQGAITTINVFMALITLAIIGRVRSGIAAFIYTNFSSFNLWLLIPTAVIALAITAPLCLILAKTITTHVLKINYNLLSIIIVFALVVLVLLVAGIHGLILLLIATLIGISTNLFRIRRVHMMGVLILPLII